MILLNVSATCKLVVTACWFFIITKLSIVSVSSFPLIPMIHDVITNFIASLAGQYLFPLLVPGFLFRSFAYVCLLQNFVQLQEQTLNT